MLNVADFPERAALRHLLAEATVRAWLSDPAVRMRVADEHLRRRVHDVLKEEEEDRSVARKWVDNHGADAAAALVAELGSQPPELPAAAVRYIRAATTAAADAADAAADAAAAAAAVEAVVRLVREQHPWHHLEGDTTFQHTFVGHRLPRRSAAAAVSLRNPLSTSTSSSRC